MNLSLQQYKAIAEKAPRSKYGNKHVAINGQRFDSIGEGDRWCDLLNLERGKLILDLKRQQKYILTDSPKPITYVADFDYFDVARNVHVTEDFKGHVTDVFKLKAKLFRARYGYDITITGRAR